MKLFVFVCVVTQLFVSNNVVANSSQPCRKSDPNLKNCLSKSLETVLPQLAAGIGEFKIRPMDPLDIPLVVFNRTLNEMTTISAVLKNVRLFGLTQLTINDFKFDVDNLAAEIKVTNPYFSLNTEFQVDGKVMNTPLATEGYFIGNFTDARNTFKISLKPIKKRGVEYFAFDQFKLKGRIAHAHIEMTTKNPRDQPLVDFLITTFNQNERQILDLFSPLYGESMGDLLRSVFNEALVKVPAERILAV